MVVVLNWNGWQDTVTCVASCRTLTWPNFRIVIVDNGSTDGSEAILRTECPDADIIQTGANLGFAGGNNIAVHRAMEHGYDYVWLLNNDTVVDPQALTMLVEALERDPSAGIAGSKIYYLDDPQRIWFAGGAWSRGRLRLRQRGAHHLDMGQFDIPGPTGSVSGCSMLVSRRVIEKIGPMDERYFLYWEDTDWCARAGKQDFRVLFVPASRVWHKVSATVAPRSELQSYYNTRSALIFCRQHDLVSLPLFLAYALADAALSLLQGNAARMCGCYRGIADFFRGRTGKRACR
jgi:GT2 family glycosyltransferase